MVQRRRETGGTPRQSHTGHVISVATRMGRRQAFYHDDVVFTITVMVRALAVVGNTMLAKDEKDPLQIPRSRFPDPWQPNHRLTRPGQLASRKESDVAKKPMKKGMMQLKTFIRFHLSFLAFGCGSHSSARCGARTHRSQTEGGKCGC